MKTQGNLTKHTITYQLQQLKQGTSVSFCCVSINGVSVRTCTPEALENGDILLAGDPIHFSDQNIFLYHMHAVDSERITFSSFKVHDEEYYCSTDDGMYLICNHISSKELTYESPKDETEQKVEKVWLFFQNHRLRLGSNLTEQQIYDSIGKPTKKALWNEWYRLYPLVFTEIFQKNFFDEPALPQITFKEGNSPSRNTIATEHQL